ncbi:protein kinase [Streptomyces sp. NPDC050560]|uniref:protein kinase domain-containing protein n=1 Tax=Streptomyces sp. NPDC050560 TaxID=3365630 RepID=UPI0037A8DB84
MHLGTTVGGRYRLVRGPLKGGSGEVWLARDGHLGRQVVLKRVLAGRESNEGFDRVRAEARALARFSHPHVVTLHDAVQAGRGRRATSWLVMEYVAGGSLDGRAPLAPERAARVGAQIADALAALHADGLVHGDVKPGNVVVTDAGLAKLGDFGAAYRVGGKETITPQGAVSYTPDFAAPEAVLGRPEPASDVFSLGAMLHALVTGRPPRPGGGEDDPFLAERRAARGLVDLSQDTGALAGILPELLARDPARRPDAAAARRRLDEVAGPQEPLPPPLEGDGGRDGTDSAAVPGRRVGAWAAARSRPVLAVGAAAVVAAAAVAATLALDGDGGGAPPRRPAAGGAAVSLIGDHRTADPCALVDPRALGGYGDAALDPAYGNFDRCDVIVDTGKGDPVDVEVVFEATGESAGKPRPLIAGVTQVDLPPESGECGRTLLPGGDRGTGITVLAKQDDKGGAGGAPAPLCRMTATAVDSAAKVLAGGTLRRRSPEPPAASLVRQDACTLLTAKDLEAVPGIDARHPEIGFGHWDCEWESTTNDMWVDLRFDRGQPLSADDGPLTRVAGHQAAVEPDEEGDGTCVVRVVHRSYRDQGGDSVVETVNVTVGGGSSGDALRHTATGLARAAVRSADGG